MGHIKTQIEKSLCANKYANNLRDIKVVVEEDGHVVLLGKVKTYFMKQMAQVIAMNLMNGERRLKNQISVEYDSQSKISW